MGEVWHAEQSAPVRRRVAVKLVKLGMDTRQVIARFEAERQALAMMDHPNIAAVLDGGATESGRPYFVMEYVPGEPITTYCDKHRLTIRGRLELFIQVCQAVQHAHQKAVIHRDIKPSNILVCLRDNQPAPKVIDFGVAKATHHRLTEQTLYTELGQIIGTPEYMSPEQAEPVPTDVDTRTDVYSLGVLLYELLTGTLPFDPKALRSRGYAEIQRIIREVDPPKPSTRLQHTLWGGSGVRRERGAPADLLGAANHPPAEDLSTAPQEADSSQARSPSPHVDPVPKPAPATRYTDIAFQRRTDPKSLWRTIRGDLDWIVMKRMEKEPSRRYGSPEEIGADLRRYLNVEPIQARPPSISYRFARGVRRHRLAEALG